MAVTDKNEQYYTASQVAKIKGITRQSVIDGCKRNQYPGARKTEPDSINTQGVWKIPASALDTPTTTKEVIEVSRAMTPEQVQATIREAVREAVRAELDPLREEIARLRAALEARPAAGITWEGDEKPPERRPWWKLWGG